MELEPDLPLALLIQPPVYDFALYDLYLRPYGLLRIGRWLAEAGWKVVFIDGLYCQLGLESGGLSGFSEGGPIPGGVSLIRPRAPRRKPDGTGKFFRQPVETPRILEPLLKPRVERGEWTKRFARYGMSVEEFRLRVRNLWGEEWGPLQLEVEEQGNARKCRDIPFAEPPARGSGSPLKPLGGEGRVGGALGVLRKGRHPDLILISSGMTYWYLGVEEAARICREEHPESPLFVGGVYATLLPEHCLRISGADGVIVGEDLEPLKKVLNARGLPIPNEPVSDRPIPFPSVWKEAGIIRLNTGCPLRCSYCASGLLSPRFKQGNPERAWKAFLELYETCGTRNFAFYDDALLFRKEEVLLPFLEQVIRYQEHRGKGTGTYQVVEGSSNLEGMTMAKQLRTDQEARFYLPNGVHVNSLDLPTAQLMRRAGVAEIRLGFESASEEFHQRYDGKVASEQFLEVVSILKQAGYEAQDISVYLLVGLPGQRAEEVEASIRFVKPLGVRVRLAEYSPVPSTRLWGESVQQCPFPLEEEPLFHNNSLFALEWEGFPYQRLLELKGMATGDS